MARAPIHPQISDIPLIISMLLPFAAGYYLSQSLSHHHSADLGVADFQPSRAHLGLLAATYFIAVAAIQLPLGVWLDRCGPRLVQTVLLSIAAVGAAVFASADGLVGLSSDER